MKVISKRMTGFHSLVPRDFSPSQGKVHGNEVVEKQENETSLYPV